MQLVFQFIRKVVVEATLANQVFMVFALYTGALSCEYRFGPHSSNEEKSSCYNIQDILHSSVLVETVWGRLTYECDSHVALHRHRNKDQRSNWGKKELCISGLFVVSKHVHF